MYYNRVAHFNAALEDKKIDKEKVDKMRLIFEDFSNKYKENYPDMGFPHLNFVIYKIIERLGYTEYKNLFPQLKDKKKIKMNEERWVRCM